LIEPFTGTAAIFLNTDYQAYLLADSNPDLITLYQQLIQEKESFIDYCESFFKKESNDEDTYYLFRNKFNTCTDSRKKSALFIYLNKHCYNGLCRYNSKGLFNTPFGRYKQPRLPGKEMQQFIAAAKHATFQCADFRDTMDMATKGDVVYCDPPYVPLSATSYFTDYHVGGFNWDDQVLLAEKARHLADRGIQVVISNHNTRAIRRLYKNYKGVFKKFDVQRSISCNANNRGKVKELLAVFN